MLSHLRLPQATTTTVFTNARADAALRGAMYNSPQKQGTLYMPLDDSGSIASFTGLGSCRIFLVGL